MSEPTERSNPYVGLRPYFLDDSLWFFGRDEQTVELLQILHEQRFLGVVGSSGSGKSSLVRAGLLPALLGGFLVDDRDRWRIMQTKPGDAPLENLAEALLRALGTKADDAACAALAQQIRDGHTDAVLDLLRPSLEANASVFLLVDQFEEVFAFRNHQSANGDAASVAWTGTFAGAALAADTPDAEEAAQRRELARRRAEAADFVDLLLGLAKQRDLPIYVALTMRTDFLGDCDLFYGLPEALNRGRYLVPRMTRQQLSSAIASPVRLLNQRIAPRLLDHLLNELGDRFDRLPVLQHALLRTWDAWMHAGGYGLIDLEHFTAAGALEGALQQDAEQALATVNLASAERVFRALTDTDISQRQVRRPSRINDLAQAAGIPRAEVEAIIAAFRRDDRNFLYTAADGDATNPRVDISHESLIRQWPRLSAWVEAEREARTVYRRLVSLAQSEKDGERDLLTEREYAIQSKNWDQLAPTAGWAARYSSSPDDFAITTRFLARSGKAIEDARLEREARLAEEERERQRRRRARWIGATSLVLGLSAGLAFVYRQSSIRKQTILDAGAVVGFVSRVHAALEPIPGTGDVRRELLENAEGLKARLGVGLRSGTRVASTEFWEELQRGDLARRNGAADSARMLYRNASAIATKEAAFGNRVWRRNLLVSELTLGDLERGLGQLDSARVHYDAALTIAKTQTAGDNTDQQAAHDLATAWTSIGDLHRDAGRFTEARAAYASALTISEQLAKNGGAERLHDLIAGNRSLADLERRAGRADSARVRYESVLRMAQQLGNGSADNTQAIADLASAYGSLGDLQKADGNLDSARALYRSALDQAISLSADPGGYLTRGYTALGDLEAAAGNTRVAGSWYVKALELEERLVRTGTEPLARRANLMLTYNRLGELALAETQLTAARDWYGKAEALGSAIPSGTPGAASLQHALWVSRTGLGDVASDAKSPRDARGWYGKALPIASALAKPGDVASQLDLWTSQKNVGDAARDERDRIVARAAYLEAVTVLERLLTGNPGSAEVRENLALSYKDLAALELADGQPAKSRDWQAKARAVAATPR